MELFNQRCDAEIADRVKMRTLLKGRLAWKGCKRKAVVEKSRMVGGHVMILCYCEKHKNRAV